MTRGRKRTVRSATGDSLRKQIMGKAAGSDIKMDKREIHVMTRLSENIVEIIDALVTLNIFKSRSEAVAGYVESSILTNIELYIKIIEQAKEVEGMRDSAMESVLETFQKQNK